MMDKLENMCTLSSHVQHDVINTAFLCTEYIYELEVHGSDPTLYITPSL